MSLYAILLATAIHDVGESSPATGQTQRSASCAMTFTARGSYPVLPDLHGVCLALARTFLPELHKLISHNFQVVCLKNRRIGSSGDNESDLSIMEDHWPE